MTVEYRSRILGDVGDNSPDHWRWGKTAPDAVVLIYGRTANSIEKLRQRLMDMCRECDAPEPHEVKFDPVTDDKTDPFGFIDGVSQPVIRGTYKSLRNADPIHIVEPGEMVLGYPDNRGYIPPSPTLEPNSDPGNKLPLLNAPNDFSRNVADPRATSASTAASSSFANSSRISTDFASIARTKLIVCGIVFPRRTTSSRSLSEPSSSAAGRTARRWCANPISPPPHTGEIDRS